MPICDICGKQTEQLSEVKYLDCDPKMICDVCFAYEDARADTEYERQKEEFDPDNPDHEHERREE